MLKTKHQLIFADSGNMPQIKDESVDLVVTSPAYPMIEMWDDFYSRRNPEIKHALKEQNGEAAFELQHKELDKTWKEVYRVLKTGGIACVNIGDATRALNGRFQLYSNHSRIICAFCEIGFHALPLILWHKKTNAPNKFMGSGMLPAGAYVTLEHEYILIFRKGGKRVFKTQKEIHGRRSGAFFWEERNKWFSDIWFDLPGVSQNINQKNLRRRSAAFPFELAYRLICMYSAPSDTTLDPFAGTGTAALAALALGRNSISVEIDKSLQPYILKRLLCSTEDLNNKTRRRILDHIQWTKDYMLKKGPMKHHSLYYDFPVMTAQETSLQLPCLKSVEWVDSRFVSADYVPLRKPKELYQLKESALQKRQRDKQMEFL